MMKWRHPMIIAREWAKKTLQAAGLPDAYGQYAPGPDGTLITPPDGASAREVIILSIADGGMGEIMARLPDNEPAGYPWIANLSTAVARIGYDNKSQELLAAKILDALTPVCSIIGREKDPELQSKLKQVASAVFAAGRLCQERRDDEFTEIGRKVWRRGRAGGVEQTEHAAHAIYLLKANELRRKGVASRRARAEAIAEELDVPFDTVHGFLRKHEKNRLCELLLAQLSVPWVLLPADGGWFTPVEAPHAFYRTDLRERLFATLLSPGK